MPRVSARRDDFFSGLGPLPNVLESASRHRWPDPSHPSARLQDPEKDDKSTGTVVFRSWDMHALFPSYGIGGGAFWNLQPPNLSMQPRATVQHRTALEGSVMLLLSESCCGVFAWAPSKTGQARRVVQVCTPYYVHTVQYFAGGQGVCSQFVRIMLAFLAPLTKCCER